MPSRLDALLAPQSVALIGANDRAGSVGDVVAANLIGGGFAGELMFVDHRTRTIHGRPVAGSVAELPGVPDLAVIATPAATIPALVGDVGARGCRAAVVISAGFEGDDAQPLRRALLDAARANDVRLVGPNCLGFLSPAHGLNASFARGTPPRGSLALVAQSGAVAAAALDWAPSHGLGFSHVATLGDCLDIGPADLLEALAEDADTRVILLYLESLADGPRFLAAARVAARAKPVVVLKGGRSPAGAKAAFSHTRALAGADAVCAAAFRKAGLLQVDGLDELFEAALSLARGWPAAPRSLAILTNGGGAGVLAVDALSRVGGTLAELSPATQATLRAALPANAATGDPVDILGDAGPDFYATSLATLLQAPEVEAVLAMNCPTAVADSLDAARAVVGVAADSPKPVFAAWLGEAAVAEGRRALATAGIPAFATPEAAVRGFARLAETDALRARLTRLPSRPEPGDPSTARRIVGAVLEAGRGALEPLEVRGVLAAYGIPVLETRIARTPPEAAAAAQALGGRVALKVLSAQIPHKSDVGGVRLDVRGGVQAGAAAREMLAGVARLRPEARLDGVLVQPMVTRPLAQEVLAGVVRDPVFGPVVVVGHGGVAVEALADRALALAPLDLTDARELIGRTRVARLLAGYRGRPAADLDALARLLVALGRLACDVPEVAELDLNPVLCDAQGVLVVDARVAVRPAAPPA